MLIAEDTCGRWLGLCRYDDIDIGLALLVLPRQTSWQSEGLAPPGFCQDVCPGWCPVGIWTALGSVRMVPDGSGGF